ncbi:hypothetical protein ACFE04_011833 [Oxalis oulophora]
MGTFVGHIVPGLALALLGLWHAINNIKAYCLDGSTKFSVKFWHPFYGPLSKLKHLELIMILIFSIFALLTQILDYPFFHLAFKLDNFEHATMFLQLAIFSAFTLSAELTRSSEILSAVSGILASSVFSQELFLLHFHSTDHVGLEGHYHWLLQLIAYISFIAAVMSASVPTSFSAALVLSISVIFQGLWFVNMGFMLWVPEYVPKGCSVQLGVGAVDCGSTEAFSRAKALANLQFCWIFSGILILTGCICLKFAARCVVNRSVAYEQLHSRGREVSIDIDGCKQVCL